MAGATYDSENRLTAATNADGTTAGPFNPAVDNMDLTFATGGNQDWEPTRAEYYEDGATNCDSAAAGVIGASQWRKPSPGGQSWLQTTVTGEGTIKFYWKKDAGTNDVFRFKVDGSTKLSKYNGSQAWTQKTHNITTGGSGTTGPTAASGWI